jgi:hypothetical protein
MSSGKGKLISEIVIEDRVNHVLLFCDTSALIKLLIDEPDSAQIHQVTERFCGWLRA